MPIKDNTDKAKLAAYVANYVKRMEKALIRRICYVGEQVVNEARRNGDYDDQTGNLRSSTGYVVVADGKVVQTSSFEVVKRGGDGSKRGKTFALELASRFPTGIALICVAGKEYAIYVSARGKNVLESAELLAKKLVPEMLKKLKLS